MQLLRDDDKQFIRALLERDVQFLVVGGHAVVHHGHLRPVNDLDVFVSMETENFERLRAACLVLGVVIPEFERRQGATKKFFLGGPHQIDILTALHDVTFEDAYADRVFARVDYKWDVPVISRAHLIRSKLFNGPERGSTDADDVAILQSTCP